MTKLLHQVKLLGENIPWLKELRQSGRDTFTALGIPNAKTEAWKYTKPNMFLTDEFEVYSAGCSANYRYEFPFATYQITFIDGVFAPNISNLPSEIEIMPLAEFMMFDAQAKNMVGKLVDNTKHPFAALNTAYLNEGIYIKIPNDCQLEKPLALVYHSSCQNAHPMSNIRNLVVLEKGAKAELIEYFNYTGDQKSVYFNNVVNEIHLGENAVLKHYKAQMEAFKAIHLALSCVEVKKSGYYKSFCLQKGADLARNESKVRLADTLAKAEVNAAYMMNGWATIDATTDIEHLVAETFSDQLVKGVVGGQAKGVFQGCIHIEPNAIKTKGYQQHRALLLTDEAEVDVKPELEIFADDVQCSHGSACGQLDAEQLFYLRSRGLGEEEAKAMLVDAYLQEVIAKVDNEKIADWIKLLLQS
ncbi:MAG: Fe-S cluster assembly protein SufD [Alphaproteobacteria bacterium]|nr:Fe-S cluster assembly protein SufD [Alphaproteobacteria bacterium]